MADLPDTRVRVQGQILEDGEQAAPSGEEARRATVAAFLATARRRWKLSADASTDLRRRMLEDKRFRASEQWPEDIRRQREADGRPCLTINRIPQFLRQITNGMRSARGRIQVNPVDNGADPKTAEAYQGVIRNIESNSDADSAYVTATEDQVTMGLGFWRVLTDYAADDSFEQEVRIRRVRNPFTVYTDPSVQELDGSDAMFAFVIEDLNEEDYRSRFPKSELAGLTAWQTTGDTPADWLGKRYRIAEYFYVETTRETIALCEVVKADGSTVRLTLRKADVEAAQRKRAEAGLEGDTYKILRERETEIRQVKWALINGVEVLEGNDDRTAGRDFPCKYIPIVSVIGEELDLDGDLDYRGIVRDAKDPGRSYNYWVSAETESIGLAPRAPYVALAGQIKGHEHTWASANNKNHSVLTYEPVQVGQQWVVTPPQRNTYEPPIAAIVAATQQADRDLKSVVGMFDASQERSPEQSGKAILARQRQGELGSSHFQDNFNRAIRYTGRILVDMIPRVYDTPRLHRILGDDGQKPKELVTHAGPSMAPAADQFTREVGPGQFEQYEVLDLSVGRYDVTVSVGPSFESRRQEAVESMIQLIGAMPQIGPMVADILTGKMDWPGAQEISKRLEKMVPPQARDEDGQIPPQAQAQIQQITQQLEQAMQQLQAAQQEIQTRRYQTDAQAALKREEIASRERIEAMKIEADRQQAVLEAKLESINKRVDHEIGRVSAEDQRRHDAQVRLEEREAQPAGPVTLAGS